MPIVAVANQQGNLHLSKQSFQSIARRFVDDGDCNDDYDDYDDDGHGDDDDGDGDDNDNVDDDDNGDGNEYDFLQMYLFMMMVMMLMMMMMLTMMARTINMIFKQIVFFTICSKQHNFENLR